VNTSIAGANSGTKEGVCGSDGRGWGGTGAAPKGGVSAASLGSERYASGVLSPPLGTNTGFGANPPPLPFPADGARLARAERYDLQRVAREVLGSDHRIRSCLRYRHFGATHVAVRNRRDTGQAYYSGLQVCAVSRRFRTATCVAPKCR